MLEITPMTLKEANAYVEQNHRHHGPVVGHKFSIGCSDGEKIVRRTSGDYAAAFAEISRLPAVDAVQVTRCRYCDGRRVEISWCGTYVRCGFRDATGLNMPEDGFCSFGKGGQ